MYIRENDNRYIWNAKHGSTDAVGMHKEEMRFNVVSDTSWTVANEKPWNYLKISAETHEQTKLAEAYVITCDNGQYLYTYRLRVRDWDYETGKMRVHSLAFGTFWAENHDAAKTMLAYRLDDMRAKLAKAGKTIVWSDAINGLWAMEF